MCREFRLGFALGGDSLARKALGEGLHARGAARRRADARSAATTTSSGGCSSRSPTRAGRVLGFQARKLHEDDPLEAKYVNTPESELFHKGSVVYGLDKARAAIAREDRACVVEGNTDVIALRQAGFQPVVARMGTALTEQQLKELGRLTKRLWLAFDGDAAGETATLRGMELAGEGVRRQGGGAGAGRRPGRRSDRFRGAARERRAVRRSTACGSRSSAPTTASGVPHGEGAARRVPDSPERQDAWRYANDKLGMTVQLRAGASTRARRAATQRAWMPARSSSERARRRARAPELRPVLARADARALLRSAAPALRAHIVDGDAARRSGRRAARGARRARRRRGHR